MKHPAREEWISYLYEEVASADKAALIDHLQGCPDCRAQVAAFQESRDALDEWKLPAARPRRPAGRTVLNWAAAAAAVLFAGFVLGRSTGPGARDLAALREEMRQLAAKATADANAETARVAAGLNETWNARLHAAELRYDADCASLRKELETVAVLTEAGFEQAQQQLVQLAEYRRPASNPSNVP